MGIESGEEMYPGDQDAAGDISMLEWSLFETKPTDFWAERAVAVTDIFPCDVSFGFKAGFMADSLRSNDEPL